MKNQRIAIIGAGTAGLAAATLLGRQGHDVTLIERAKSLTAVGAGILLQPSGIGVLSEIGCLEHMLQYGHRIDALYGWNKSGRVIMQVQYSHLKANHDLFGLGVHRASLCHVLDTALIAVPHKRWFGCEVNSIQQSAREAIVSFHNETQEHREAFDAVLIANGSASQLRPQSLVQYDRQYPWGAMWLIRPLNSSLSPLNKPLLQQRYDGSRRMLGVLPTGYIPNDTCTQMLSLFWSLPVASIPNWQNENFDFEGWKNSVVDLWPELSTLINSIQSASELLPATYRDVILSRWGVGRIGVIGDAAHAMSPQLGQGANMALLDASAISAAVAVCDDWESVWAQFTATRSGSIRFYQRMSRLLTPLFQSNYLGAAFVRDMAIPISHHLPWLRQQMAETVAGRKQKWL
ncbi:MAG: FAD-dependent monooxygenase [Arenimonas sp.]|nr:FAD-dependent monooxygenase [Arenimonas sp.]